MVLQTKQHTSTKLCIRYLRLYKQAYIQILVSTTNIFNHINASSEKLKEQIVFNKTRYTIIMQNIYLIDNTMLILLEVFMCD